MKNRSNNNPLTLDQLGQFFHKEMIPAMEERFVTKKEFQDFRDENLGRQDNILKRLTDLETEDAAHTAMHDRQEEKLEKHEKRVYSNKGT